MASALRRTDDLQRLKTRNLVLQNTSGGYPNADGIVYIDDAAGHVGTTGATYASINSNGYITCNNIKALNRVNPADDNEFTSMSIKNKDLVTVGRIATSAGATDQMYIEGARFIYFTDIDVATGDKTMTVDTYSNIVTVDGNLDVNGNCTVRGVSDLRTAGADNVLTTTSVWSNAGHTSGEIQVGRLATDGAPSFAPTGTFYVQGSKYVTLTTINNTGGRMPVHVDVSNNLTSINGSLVMQPVGLLPKYINGAPYSSYSVPNPGSTSGVPIGTMYFTGATLYIRTDSGANNGWKSVSLGAYP